MLCIDKVIKTPVMIPIVNANIIKRVGLTAKNSNAIIIKHINTAKNDTVIIKNLFFIMRDFNELRYK